MTMTVFESTENFYDYIFTIICFSFVIVLIEEIKQKLEIMFDLSASHLEGGQKYSGIHLFSTLFSVFQNVVNCDHLCLMHYVKLALQKFTKIVSCAL